jgi:hypothetical protein
MVESRITAGTPRDDVSVFTYGADSHVRAPDYGLYWR